MLIAALLGAGLLAGCGGDDEGDKQEEVKKTFEEDYKPLNDDLIALGDEVGRAVNTAEGKSDAALATQFTRLGEETQEIKRKLDELEPPEELPGGVGETIPIGGFSGFFSA